MVEYWAGDVGSMKEMMDQEMLVEVVYVGFRM
jgi:hypothetical protein